MTELALLDIVAALEPPLETITEELPVIDALPAVFEPAPDPAGAAARDCT